MCGIAGIYAYHYAAVPVDRDELRLVRDARASRGLDGAGEGFSQDGRVRCGLRARLGTHRVCRDQGSAGLHVSEPGGGYALRGARGAQVRRAGSHLVG